MEDVPFPAKLRHSDITGEIIAAAIEVHRRMGPGLLESIYGDCLEREFELRALASTREVSIPLEYKGMPLSRPLRADFVVAGMVIVEVKAVARLEPVHDAQLLTYLKLSGLRVGLMFNFHVPVLRNGIRRLVL